jgi:hypothetical protein
MHTKLFFRRKNKKVKAPLLLAFLYGFILIVLCQCRKNTVDIHPQNNSIDYSTHYKKHLFSHESPDTGEGVPAAQAEPSAEARVRTN